jgi:hypothetical protein
VWYDSCVHSRICALDALSKRVPSSTMSRLRTLVFALPARFADRALWQVRCVACVIMIEFVTLWRAETSSNVAAFAHRRRVWRRASAVRVCVARVASSS